MKEFKKLGIAIFMIATIFSCQNDDNYELEQNLMNETSSKTADSDVRNEIIELGNQNTTYSADFEYEDPDNPPPDPFIRSKILIEYLPGTTEAEKAAFRNSVALDIMIFNHTICPLNPNAETWQVGYLTEQRFNDEHKDGLEGDEDVDRAVYEARCR